MAYGKKSWLEKELNYTFKKKKYLNRALTHSTYANEQKQKKKISKYPDQEVYSTFGDGILRAILADLLIERKMSSKGIISIKRQKLENNLKLAEVGERLKLIESGFIQLGKGRKNQVDKGGKKILADTVEAIIAAIFIDSGYSYKKTRRCVQRLFKSELETLEKEINNIS
jgi:ribonuclease-3